MYFVTGATGLLGTHVLVELIRRGESVRALKRKDSQLDDVRAVFDYYLGQESKAAFEKIEWVDGNVLDLISLRDGMQGCDKVVHCAAKVSFVKRDFHELIKVNKDGTANVVNTALDLGVKQLIYSSSTATIGQTEGKDIFDESDAWFRSKENSNYSVSKYLGEMEVWRGVEEGLDAVIVNPSLILGPGNWNTSSISMFKVIKKGLKFYTPGGNAFVDARDVARIMLRLSDEGIVNEKFLVFTDNLKFKDVFDLMAKSFKVKGPTILTSKLMAGIAWRWEGLMRFFFGRKQNITKESARSAMKITRFSNQKIKDRIGYEFIPIEDTIENAVRYFELKY